MTRLTKCIPLRLITVMLYNYQPGFRTGCVTLIVFFSFLADKILTLWAPTLQNGHTLWAFLGGWHLKGWKVLMKIHERETLMYKKDLALEIIKRCLKIEAFLGIWCDHSYLHERLFSQEIKNWRSDYRKILHSIS